MSPPFHLHLVSDSTGETIHGIARACLVQFEGIEVKEHLWPMVRTPAALQIVMEAIAETPGMVLYTLIDDHIRDEFRRECAQLHVRAVSVLQPVMRALQAQFGILSRGEPGRQHQMDEEYFNRMEAMNFVMAHDDGQAAWGLADADIVLVGVSRTSKSPTSIYLGNRGYRTANVPIVPGSPLPPELFSLRRPLVVGLTNSPDQLVGIRRNRLQMLRQEAQGDYVDPERVRDEVQKARRLCAEHGWPVIDVTRKSIEETAISIIQLLEAHQKKLASAAE